MKTFELEDYFFHYINENGLSAMCMTDKTFERKLTFAFLQDLKQSLLNIYTPRDLQNAGPNSMSTFVTTIQEKIVSFDFNVIRLVGVLELAASRLRRQDRLTGQPTKISKRIDARKSESVTTQRRENRIGEGALGFANEDIRRIPNYESCGQKGDAVQEV